MEYCWSHPQLKPKRLVKPRIRKTGELLSELSRLVPGAGLEPARPFGSTDFKSVVSTNSTIQAGGLIKTGQI